MSMIKKQQIEGTKEILKYSNHFVAIPYNVKKGDTNAVVENGVKVIKAGTILPANDATALGVVLSDTVVEYDGGRGVAVPLVIHGFIDGTKLPKQPAQLAINALSQIKFFDVTPS